MWYPACEGGFSARRPMSLLRDWDCRERGFLQGVSTALSSFLSEALLEGKERKKDSSSYSKSWNSRRVFLESESGGKKLTSKYGQG